MRKKLVTCLAALILLPGAAFAGGVGEPEIEPEVFEADEEVAAGTLASNSGLILLGLVIGGLVIAGDSD